MVKTFRRLKVTDVKKHGLEEQGKADPSLCSGMTKQTGLPPTVFIKD